MPLWDRFGPEKNTTPAQRDELRRSIAAIAMWGPIDNEHPDTDGIFQTHSIQLAHADLRHMTDRMRQRLPKPLKGRPDESVGFDVMAWHNQSGDNLRVPTRLMIVRSVLSEQPVERLSQLSYNLHEPSSDNPSGIIWQTSHMELPLGEDGTNDIDDETQAIERIAERQALNAEEAILDSLAASAQSITFHEAEEVIRFAWHLANNPLRSSI